MTILSPGISESDSKVSAKGITLLRPYLEDTHRSLVFVVGAGASMAGNTGMPSTPSLLYRLFLDSLTYSGGFDDEIDSYRHSLKEISPKLGFEITLNDFWQICRDATSYLYTAFAELEQECMPNRVHIFLAHWLASRGSVVTTNYDRLIEQEWAKLSPSIKKRFRNTGENSFESWQDDLKDGGCLFKIHGSLDDPSSCLGALEHVGIQLKGNRAKLLMDIMQNRPICFVGWRGVDPDIPPLLDSAMADRDPTLPIFWIHYEGDPPGSFTLEKTLQGMSTFVKPLASQHPILTEADRAFGEMLNGWGVKREPNPYKEPLSFDFNKSVSQCTKTGATRMVGIALRRGGKFEIAEHVLNISLSLAKTKEEQSAILEELSLLHQQIGGRRTGRSRKYLSRARKALGDQPDPWMQLNTDFGLLSQTIVALKNRPWLLLRLPVLFHQYRQDIEIFRQRTTDLESTALHESLFHLCQGRLRFKVFGWLAKIVHPFAGWIRRPFDTAKSIIKDAKDIHVHSHIDVLAYRAAALAYLRFCSAAKEDIPEIERLVAILNDDARTRHWDDQKRQIELCIGSFK
jgi:hypothetical protein